MLLSCYFLKLETNPSRTTPLLPKDFASECIGQNCITYLGKGKKTNVFGLFNQHSSTGAEEGSSLHGRTWPLWADEQIWL
jgi:hypothetical protein